MIIHAYTFLVRHSNHDYYSHIYRIASSLHFFLSTRAYSFQNRYSFLLKHSDHDCCLHIYKMASSFYFFSTRKIKSWQKFASRAFIFEIQGGQQCLPTDADAYICSKKPNICLVLFYAYSLSQDNTLLICEK